MATGVMFIEASKAMTFFFPRSNDFFRSKDCVIVVVGSVFALLQNLFSLLVPFSLYKAVIQQAGEFLSLLGFETSEVRFHTMPRHECLSVPKFWCKQWGLH